MLDTAGDWLHRLTGNRFGIGPGTLRLERVTVGVPGLPPALAGFRIGLLSDLHAGRFVSAAVVARAAEMLAAEDPDLTVVAGDFTDGTLSRAELEAVLTPLAALGPVGVRGNWDCFDDAVLRQRPVRILLNRGLLVRPMLWLAGIDDQIYGEPDLLRALAGAPPGAVRILLAHEPDLAARIRPEHKVALVLSGHTHGGQVRLPWVGPVILPPKGRRFVAGLYRAPACQVYVSRGVGVIHLPIRIGCPPEVTILTLSGTQEAATAKD